MEHAPIEQWIPDASTGWVPLASIVGWDRNPNRHPPAQVTQLAANFRRFGFVDAVTIARIKDEGVLELRAGHGRVEGLNAILREDPEFVPSGAPGPGLVRALIFDFPTRAAADAYGVANNRLAEIADSDEEAIAAILRELDADGFSLDGLGWEDGELEALLNAAGSQPEAEKVLVKEGDAPTDSPPERPDSVPGEVYELGPHRLICGDCRDLATVARLVGERRVNVAFTSPPYASQRKYDESSGFKPIPPAEYVAWFADVQANVRAVLAEDGSWFVNIKEHSEDGQRSLYVKILVVDHVVRWGWRHVDEFCWLRQSLPGDPRSMLRFKNGFEPVFHFATGLFKFRPDAVQHESEHAFSYADQKAAGRDIRAASQGKGLNAQSPVGQKKGLAYPSNVLDIMQGARVVGHSAAFPVALPEFFIKAYSDPGDLVYDPFMGSGTTLIAAAQNGRHAVGCEISAGYCDVIRRRWTKWALANGQDPGSGALQPVTEGL
jgi:DNA modification methylase